jgi:hypothetical protein
VLFADVKSSMELAESLDPEECHRMLERFLEIRSEDVHRFEGPVNQYTGDGHHGALRRSHHPRGSCAARLLYRAISSMSCGNVAGTLTDVGAYTGSASPYGSFDQGGNVYQWNEQMVAHQRDQHLVITGSDGSLLGGSWSYYAYALAGASADLGSPTIEGNYIGFRVASISANGQPIANAQALDCATGPERAILPPLLMRPRSKRRQLTP